MLAKAAILVLNPALDLTQRPNLDPAAAMDLMNVRFEPLSKVISMYKRMTLSSLILLAFLGVAPLLGACHTTAGAGQDISKTGQAITRTANNATPR
jgi:predicted small secreted protein